MTFGGRNDVITLETIDDNIIAELNKMRTAANIGDSKQVEIIGGRILILTKNALLLARRRSKESEVLFRNNPGPQHL